MQYGLLSRVVVLDDGGLLLTVVNVRRLDLAGDVGDVVSGFASKQVVDKRVNLCILSPLRQAIEDVDYLDLDGRFFRRCGRRSRGRRSPLRFIGGDVLRGDLLVFLSSVFCLLDLVLLAGRTRCRPWGPLGVGRCVHCIHKGFVKGASSSESLICID